jgi:dihydrofolate reductase
MVARVAMIVAVAQNRVIGRNNELPWRLPGDLPRFKTITMGKPVIMGRATFDSIGKPLAGRDNIIISRDASLKIEGAAVVATPTAALDLARIVAAEKNLNEIIVMGGGQIYAEFLPQADRLYLTKVLADVDGDAYFPAVDANEWVETSNEPVAASGDNLYPFCYVTLDRK